MVTSAARDSDLRRARQANTSMSLPSPRQASIFFYCAAYAARGPVTPAAMYETRRP